MAETLGRDIGGSEAHPPGLHSIGCAQTGPLRDLDFYDSEMEPVEPGKRYGISAYMSAVGASARLFISWHAPDGAYIEAAPSSTLADGAEGGGDLGGWPRVHVFGTAPGTAASMRFNVRMLPSQGATAALVRLIRPVIEEALPGQMQPSLWSESASGMRAAFREAQDATTTEIEAVSQSIQTMQASFESDVLALQASITNEQTARTTADSAIATSVREVSARISDGGDIKQAIVSVQSQATATATAVSGSYSVVIGAGGKVTGIKLIGSSTSSQFLIDADETIINGTVKAKHMAAESVSTTALQTGAVVADKIAVNNLAAISANLGTITAGLLRNSTGTTLLNLNETGSGELLRVNGVTRVFADGRTRWRNQIAALTIRPRSDGSNAASAWDSQNLAYKVLWITIGSYEEGLLEYNYHNGVSFTVDTGIAMSSVTDAYDAQLSARVTGWAIWWGRAPVAADALLIDARPIYRLPVSSGQDWGNVTLHLEITARFRDGSPIITSHGDPVQIAELAVSVFRLS